MKLGISKLRKLPLWAKNAIGWGLLVVIWLAIAWDISKFGIAGGLFFVIIIAAGPLLSAVIVRFYPQWDDCEYRSLVETIVGGLAGVGAVVLFLFILSL